MSDEAKSATPPDQLEQHIMDSRVAKSEAEWWARSALLREREERNKAEDFILREGYRACNIAACNCGKWHGVEGLHRRWRELENDLSEAGHPLTNDNGHVLRKALASLIEERNRKRERCARLEKELIACRRVAAALDGVLVGYRIGKTPARWLDELSKWRPLWDAARTAVDAAGDLTHD